MVCGIFASISLRKIPVFLRPKFKLFCLLLVFLPALISLSFLQQTNSPMAQRSDGASSPRWSRLGQSCNFTGRVYEHHRRLLSGWLLDRHPSGVGHLQMMRWLVVLLLLLPSLHVRASGIVAGTVVPGKVWADAGHTRQVSGFASDGTTTGTHTYPYGTYGYATYTAACVTGVYTQVSSRVSGWSGGTPSGVCTSYHTVAASAATYGDGWVPSYTQCPANSTGTTTCTCTDPYIADGTGTFCAIPTCLSAVGTVFESGYFDLGTVDSAVMPVTICHTGCDATFEGFGSAIARTTINGVYHYYAKGFYSNSATGLDASCSPDTPDGVQNSIGANVPNPTCGVEQSLGWVNGIPLCVNSSSTSTSTPPVTTTSTSTSETNASGVTTTTTMDNSPSGGTTTTTTIVNPDGTSSTSISSSTNPEVNSMFCQQFPSDPSCAPQSDCDLNPDSIGCLDAGTPGDSLALGTQSVSVGITAVNFGIAAGCPADRQITVWGGGVVPIPLDQICDFATMIKPLVLAMAWLAAGFIVFGSFKQG